MGDLVRVRVLHCDSSGDSRGHSLPEGSSVEVGVRADCLEEVDSELSVGTRGGQRTLGKVRPGDVLCTHPGILATCPRSAHQQERKPCWAGWGSGAGRRVYHSTCQLSHGARPTDPPLTLTQVTLTMSPLCAGWWEPGGTSCGSDVCLPALALLLLLSDFVQGPLVASVSPRMKWEEGAEKLK